MRDEKAAWRALACFFERTVERFENGDGYMATGLGLCTSICQSGASRLTREAMLRKIRRRGVRMFHKRARFFAADGSVVYVERVGHAGGYYQWPVDEVGHRARAAWARAAAKRC